MKVSMFSEKYKLNKVKESDKESNKEKNTNTKLEKSKIKEYTIPMKISNRFSNKNSKM